MFLISCGTRAVTARIPFRVAAAALIAAVLGACGGGSSTDQGTASAQSATGTAGATTRASTRAASTIATGAASTAASGSTLAAEGGTFSVSGTQAVQFGAGTSWVVMNVNGTGQCTAAFFGLDPDVGTVKSCELAASVATTLAQEGGSFTVSGTQTVEFGAGSSWVTRSVTGTAQCSNSYFGSDPDVGVAKSCQSGTATKSQLAVEGGNFTVSGTQTVLFGAGTTWLQQSLSGPGKCSIAFFGGDPDVGTVKSCQLVVTTNSALAVEGGTFTVAGTQTVQFGAGSSWVQMSVTGTGQCTNAFFGTDPDVGTVKSCELVSAGTGTSTAGSGDTNGTGSTGTTTGTTSTSSAATVTAWVRVAAYGDPVALSGTTPQVVRYGDGSNWVSATVRTGTACVPASFGSDPAPYTPEFCETQVTASTVTQTGNAPVINTALIPAAAVSYTTPRVMALSAAQLASATFQPVATDVGAFRDTCNFSHILFDDPIVFPGVPGASHLHTFVGNDQTNASSTAASMAGSGGSTCAGGTLNRTGYWQPTLVDIRTGQPVVPIDTQMYYKVGYEGVQASTIKPFPTGLRMIAGFPDTKVPISSLARFSCLSGGSWQASIPTCAVGDNMMASVTFPQCWDGVNLDSPDHKSHMAYGTGTGCPADHPVALPEVTIRFDYKVAEANSGAFWKLSSDNYAGPSGYSIHADWFYGWDATTHATFVADCVNASMDCHDYLLGNGSMLY